MSLIKKREVRSLNVRFNESGDFQSLHGLSEEVERPFAEGF